MAVNNREGNERGERRERRNDDRRAQGATERVHSLNG